MLSHNGQHYGPGTQQRWGGSPREQEGVGHHSSVQAVVSWGEVGQMDGVQVRVLSRTEYCVRHVNTGRSCTRTATTCSVAGTPE